MQNTQITIGQEYQVDATGKSVPVSVTGSPLLASTLLLANETVSSGWLERGQYLGAITTIYSTVPGSYLIEYSEDGGETFAMPSITVPYTLVETTRKGAFDISASFVRFTYKNGGINQIGHFKFEVRFLSNAAQISAETLNAAGADTRLAMWTKSRIETKDNDTGTYAPIYRQGNSLKVHLTNQEPIMVSLVGMESGGDAPNGMVAVTNFPQNQQVTVANPTEFPTSIEVSNFPNTQNFPSTIEVSNFPEVESFPATIEVSNFPDVQEFPSTIEISNFPATQEIVGSVYAHITNSPTVNIGTIPTIEIANDVGNPIPISGAVSVTFPTNQAVTVSNPTSSVTVLNSDYAKNITLTDGSQKTQVTSLPALATGINVIGSIANTGFNINNLPTVQPISDNGGSITVDGTVNANVTFPTTQQVTITNTPTVNANVTFPATQVVTGPLTDAQLRASTIAVAGNFYQATQPVSVTTLPLPTSASTSALQSTGNTSLNNIDNDLGSPSDTLVSDPTLSGSIIALLKGILQSQNPSTAASTSILSMAANTIYTVATSATAKRGVSIFSTNGTVYILEGTGTVSSTFFTERIITNGSFLSDFGFSGTITVFATAASSINITLFN